jgi:hypothetical protein
MPIGDNKMDFKVGDKVIVSNPEKELAHHEGLIGTVIRVEMDFLEAPIIFLDTFPKCAFFDYEVELVEGDNNE